MDNESDVNNEDEINYDGTKIDYSFQNLCFLRLCQMLINLLRLGFSFQDILILNEKKQFFHDEHFLLFYKHFNIQDKLELKEKIYNYYITKDYIVSQTHAPQIISYVFKRIQHMLLGNKYRGYVIVINPTKQQKTNQELCDMSSRLIKNLRILNYLKLHATKTKVQCYFCQDDQKEGVQLILDCGHQICLECFEIMILNMFGNNDVYKLCPNMFMKCGVCRQKINNIIQVFPIN